MKKILVPLFLAALVITSMSSCKKLVDKIFNGVDVQAPNFTVTIPIIHPLAAGQNIPGPSITRSFNLDSLIRANTADVFGLDNVKSVKIKSVTVNTPNGDGTDNVSSFERFSIILSSNTNSTPVTMATVNFPNVNQNTYTEVQTNSSELLPYLKGSQITYQSEGRVRRGTSKELSMVISILLRVE